jgi:hypothetical protein
MAENSRAMVKTKKRGVVVSAGTPFRNAFAEDKGVFSSRGAGFQTLPSLGFFAKTPTDSQDDDSVGEPEEKQQVPPLRFAPDFLWRLVALANFMRLRTLKALPFRKMNLRGFYNSRFCDPTALFLAQRLGGIDACNPARWRNRSHHRYRCERQDDDEDGGKVVDAYSIEHTVHSTQCSRT